MCLLTKKKKKLTPYNSFNFNINRRFGFVFHNCSSQAYLSTPWNSYFTIFWCGIFLFLWQFQHKVFEDVVQVPNFQPKFRSQFIVPRSFLTVYIFNFEIIYFAAHLLPSILIFQTINPPQTLLQELKQYIQSFWFSHSSQSALAEPILLSKNEYVWRTVKATQTAFKRSGYTKQITWNPQLIQENYRVSLYFYLSHWFYDLMFSL